LLKSNTHANAGWRFAIDRGGTFTDVVGIAPGGGLHTCKVLSRDPHRPEDPALRGIRQLIARHGRGDERVAGVRLGTTVATNALLERKGAATLLVTSSGMRDALLIGYQERPDIFARAIRRPPPLYRQVVEVPERVTATGEVLVPLDEAALRQALASARQDGIEAVAIAFLHGFRHPAHEARAAAIAREAGFGEVIASHAAAPLLGYIARGDTTVADAYLSPVLLRYTTQFERSLRAEYGDVAVSYMQSNGGLVDAAGFRGVSGVLSGPAGGVVGMIAAGSVAGARRLIGFDMGGTSTDVSLSTGAIPRRFSAEIDGVRLQAPLGAAVRRRAPAGRPRLRRRRSGPSLLWPRRSRDDHRLQRRAWPHSGSALPARVRAWRRPADRAPRIACATCGTGRRGARGDWPRLFRRDACGRVPRSGLRPHGQRDP
jgi:5-oxoprolinase (ATP-hydrolysing)